MKFRYTHYIKLLLASLLMLAFNLAGTDIYAANDVEISTISGENHAPRRHSRIKDTERLSPQEANRIYQLVRQAMANGYSESGLSLLQGYQSQEKFNTAPYRSAAHGNHYLNNYGNALASVYGQYEAAGRFPVGAVLFKDSFSVAANRSIILGPMFIMVKMPEGYNPVSGDWKYIQIQPTGELLGQTNGQGSDKVEYCIACHLAQEKQDHLFFIPDEYRK